MHDLLVGPRVERGFAVNELEDQDAQAPRVHVLAVVRPLHHLRRHVLVRSAEGVPDY